MDWKSIFKKVTVFSWMLCLITFLVLIIRYTASDIEAFLSWDYPLIWLFILGCIFCVLAIFWPKKTK